MVNYSNGKIYKIENNVDDMIYIGSTTKQYLSQRMDSHRSNFKRWKNGGYHNISVFEMFDKHGVENCKIVLLQLVNCESKDELLAREAFYIKSLVCVNKYIPLRTPQEYYIDNIEKIMEHKKQYYNDNIEKILQDKKQYRVDNKDKINDYQKAYRVDNKEKLIDYQKEYRVDNKEKILEQKKQYYNDNKEKILEQKKQNYNDNKEKTIIHLTYLENNNN